MFAPLFIAMGVALVTWRLMLRLPASVGVLERLLFAFASFLIACGSGPLAISLAVLAITRRDGSLGAAGLWALISIAVGGSLFVLGIVVTALRVAVYGRDASRV